MRRKFSIWSGLLISLLAVATAVTVLPACGSKGRDESNNEIKW
jgi:hypothetical protein